VDLDEIELVLAINEKLAGAGVGVVGGPDQPHRGLADVLAHLWRQSRRGRLLDELLVAALQRTITLPEVDDVAVMVGEDLHLDVARLLDVLFEVDAAVLERALGFLACGLKAGLEADVVAGDANAAAPAAGRRLDEHGIAHAVSQREGLFLIGDQSLAAGHYRDADSLGELAGLVLVAEQTHGLDGRADELDLAGAADLGEVRVLGEEAVAGVDGLDVGQLGGADEPWDFQVALGRRGRADADGLVGQLEVGGAAVGLAVDGDHFDAEVLAGADDPQGDLTAIGNQDTLEHDRW